VSRSIRQDVIQFITSRPNETVTRDEIVRGCGGTWSGRQVRDAVRRVIIESPIGREIETIVQGSMWRFVPSHVPAVTPAPTTTTDVAPASNPDLPLTTLIREYLINHPRAVVSLEELVAYTGRTSHQVQVGVNNMRRITSNVDVTSYLETEAHGRLWRFNPPADWRPGRRPNRSVPTPPPIVLTAPPTTATPTGPTTGPADVEPTASTNGQVAVGPVHGDGPRLFEEVGNLRDGRLVISDQDGNMYTATPMN
jgi:hypothetical protein